MSAQTNELAACKAELSKGYIGQVEYQLHKDKRWIASSFKTLKEMDRIIENLQIDGYKVDLIVFFESRIHKLENPNNSASDNLKFLHNYLGKLHTENLKGSKIW